MERAIDKFDQYVDGVLDGSIVASELVVKLVKRHVNDLKRSKSGDLPYVFRRDYADIFIEMVPILFKHTVGKYAGTPFQLAPWQAFIVGMIFGWVNDNGKRRFRTLYITLARKQGKTTFAAVLAIILTCFDNEAQAQTYFGATKRDQAKLVFMEVKRMISRSQELKQILRPRALSIEMSSTDSVMMPLSSDKPFDGLNPHCNIVDELHAFKERHREFWDTVTTGSASREQPLDVIITTAGDANSLIWKEVDDYAVKVLKGQLIDETNLAFIARLDDKSELFDEEMWLKAMPNLGVSCNVDDMRRKANELKNKGSAGINRWTRYYANLEVSNIEQAIDPEDWDACQVDELSDWSYADAKATAIDAGGGNDLFASVDVARFEDGQTDDGKQDFRYEVKCRCYMDEATSRDLSEQPWQSWIYTDQLTVVSSLFSSVKQDTTERMYQEGIRQIGFDPWNMQQMGEQFIEDGFEAVKIPQNRFNLHEPLTLLLDLVKRGKISHDGHPILKFAITNLVINSDSQNRWMPDRKNSKEKIDPAVALIMALRLASLAKSQPKGSLFIA
jgi:phage terminase large subunit-like protein